MATKHNTKRQASDHILSTYVTHEVKQEFEAHCRRQHRTMAAEMRMLIEQHLASEPEVAAA